MFGWLRREPRRVVLEPGGKDEADAREREQRAREADAEGRLPNPTRPSELWVDSFGVIATRALQGMLILAAVAILAWGLLQVSIVVIPLLLALIVASSMEPVLHWLGRHGWPRTLSTVTVLLLVVVVFGGLIWIVVMQVMSQWDHLVETSVKGFHQLVEWWNGQFPQVAVNQEHLGDLGKTAEQFVGGMNFGAVGSGLASGLSAFGSFVTGAVLFVVILFFFLKDGPKIWHFLIRPLPTTQFRRAELMGARAVGVMGGYVRGTVLVALVDAVFIGLGMFFVGVPLWLPLALVVFILAFVPIVGATLAGVIAALVTLVTNDLVAALVVAGIVLVVNQLESNLLQPVVLGRSLKLHELVVLVALTTGAVLGGIIGTLIAVPLTAVGWALIKAWNESLPQLEAEVAEDDTIRERLRMRWQRSEHEE